MARLNYRQKESDLQLNSSETDVPWDLRNVNFTSFFKIKLKEGIVYKKTYDEGTTCFVKRLINALVKKMQYFRLFFFIIIANYWQLRSFISVKRHMIMKTPMRRSDKSTTGSDVHDFITSHLTLKNQGIVGRGDRNS